tara:strand:+ start:538 stop:846 length:309 start_codon:yes stop_codon:yes gene_type:complete
MDHLHEYVKENMDFTRFAFNNEEMSDEELFDVVMENVVSSVECYGWEDYKKDMEKNQMNKCEMTEEEVLECISKLIGYLRAKDALLTERIENAIYNLEDELK